MEVYVSTREAFPHFTATLMTDAAFIPFNTPRNHPRSQIIEKHQSQEVISLIPSEKSLSFVHCFIFFPQKIALK